jgi:hypothetical protein
MNSLPRPHCKSRAGESIVGVDSRLQAARLERELSEHGGGAAVARMALTFDMQPIYEIVS